MSEFDDFGLLLTFATLWIYGGYSLYKELVKDKVIEKSKITAVIVTAGGPVSLVVMTIILWSD